MCNQSKNFPYKSNKNKKNLKLSTKLARWVQTRPWMRATIKIYPKYQRRDALNSTRDQILIEKFKTLSNKSQLIKLVLNHIIPLGHWTYEEHYSFLKFIEENRELFLTSTQKKLNRVFKLMSKLIPSRTAC